MIRRPPRSTLFPTRRSSDLIFVEVGGEWCTWCHILDRFFHEHPNLEALRDKNYVPMKVSMSQENPNRARSEEHTSELQSQSNLVCRLLLEKKKNKKSSGRQ